MKRSNYFEVDFAACAAALLRSSLVSTLFVVSGAGVVAAGATLDAGVAVAAEVVASVALEVVATGAAVVVVSVVFAVGAFVLPLHPTPMMVAKATDVRIILFMNPPYRYEIFSIVAEIRTQCEFVRLRGQ